MTQNSALKRFLQRDRVVRGLTNDGHFRVGAVNLTNTVITAQERHGLSPVAAVFLGRLMAGATLLSSFLKGEERIILEAMGQGPLKRVYAEAVQVGEVRGYVENPQAMLDFSTDTSLGDALGLGLFRVTRILYNQFEPVVGIVELAKGDISTDLAYYLTQSEQVPSAVMLDVSVDDEGKVIKCGGLIVQAMPGAPESEIVTIQDNLRNVTPITDLLGVGYTPEEVLRVVIPGEYRETNHARVDFFCRCSVDRFKSILLSLGAEELTSMRDLGQTELVCQYCNERYDLPADEFEALIEQARARTN